LVNRIKDALNSGLHNTYFCEIYIGITKVNNHSTFRLRFSEVLCPIGLKFLLQVLDTVWGAYLFLFVFIFCSSNKKAKTQVVEYERLIVFTRINFVNLPKNSGAKYFNMKRSEHLSSV
jgi:hypothetical protein